MYTELLAGLIVWCLVAMAVLAFITFILDGIGKLADNGSYTRAKRHTVEPKILTAKERDALEANKWWWQK